MVKDHRQFRKFASESGRMFQMLDKEQQVERDAMFLKHFQTANHFGTNNEIIVRLILSYMPDTDKLWVVSEFQQLLFALLAGQVYPTHDSRDEIVLLGHAEQPTSFRDVVLGLHDDRSVHPDRTDQRLQVFRQIVAADRCEFFRVLPRIIKRLGVLPKVMVRIYDQYGFPLLMC